MDFLALCLEYIQVVHFDKAETLSCRTLTSEALSEANNRLAEMLVFDRKISVA
jgi:hypothetical protein